VGDEQHASGGRPRAGKRAHGRPAIQRVATGSEYGFGAIPSLMAELQRALLPARLPVLPRARIAARYQAARDGDTAGGDWFDAIPLSDGAVALAVGDVAGGGPGAAAAMGRLRAVLGDQLATGPGLTAALARIDALARRTPELFAATMTLALLRPADGSLRYVTCGHPPLLVLGAGGGTRFLAATGSGPLGTGSDLAPRTVALRPDDSLLFYTDGLIQQPGSSVADGMTELATAAASAVTGQPASQPSAARDARAGVAQGPSHLCSRTMELMSRGGFADDVTTLAVQLVAEPVAALRLSLHAEETSVLRVRRAFSNWLTAIDADVEGLDDLMLAVTETVTNAVEHAYPPGQRGIVEFTAGLEQDGTLECLVADHGRWRPPDPATPYRGHGLMVAGQVVDQIKVSARRQEGGTVVMLRHRLGRPASITTGAGQDASPDGSPPPKVSFSFDLDSAGRVPRGRVRGPVTGGSAGRLAQRLLAACRGGTLPLLVDLSGVTYLSGAAVRAIYQVRELLMAHGQDLAIVAAAGSAASALLDVVRLPHVPGEPGETRSARHGQRSGPVLG
jgi:serine phosphatase RsbU (regulator of sigma subunit)/anti-sigma regulatory factor (Ser/Thr protein kinase)